MRTASWIVTSHHRPELLIATLEHLRDGIALGNLPYGWQVEVVVVCAAGDIESAHAAQAFANVILPTKEQHPSGKRNVGLRECTGELVMTTDDDDFQCHRRAALAIQVYEQGALLSGIKEFRRLFLATGNVVRYCGQGMVADFERGIPELAPVFCGTARNYAKKVLLQHNGWDPRLTMLEDHDLHRRITKRRGAGDAGVVEYDLTRSLAMTTIACQHESNIIDRPPVGKGEQMRHGDYWIIGEGHYSEIPDFPIDVARRLRAVGKLA